MLWHKCPEHPKCIPSCRFNRHWDFELLQHTSKERNHGPDGPLVCLNNPAGFASTEGPSGHTETSDGIPDPRCTASTKKQILSCACSQVLGPANEWPQGFYSSPEIPNISKPKLIHTLHLNQGKQETNQHLPRLGGTCAHWKTCKRTTQLQTTLISYIHSEGSWISYHVW